jgi:UDP-N-acetylglucosamine 4-epimerase
VAAVLDFQDTNVLVTGGAGFIGSHLVDALVQRSARVRVLDNFATGRRENLTSVLDRIELVEGDIRDLEACRRAADGVAFVFHQAALGSVPRSLRDPSTTLAVNVMGTVNVFEACRIARVRRVIYASSSSVYGDSPRLPKREGEEGRLLSPYAVSKAINEQLAGVFGRCYGLELIGLRYFNVYGPRQVPEGPYAAVVPRFFRACLAGEAPVIYGDGSQSRDFTFVPDAVAANLLACAAPAEACGRAYNAAGGSRTTILDLSQLIRQVVGSGPEPRFAPARPGDVQHSCADLTLSRSFLGYEPRTTVREGLQASCSFYGDSSQNG